MKLKLPWALTVCEFYRDCPLYRREDYTCNEALSKDFCGKYKNRKYGPVMHKGVVLAFTVPSVTTLKEKQKK